MNVPYCRDCGYCLAGLRSTTIHCPECGNSIDWVDAYARVENVGRHRRVAGVLLAIAGGVALPTQLLLFSGGYPMLAILGTQDGLRLVGPWRAVWLILTLAYALLIVFSLAAAFILLRCHDRSGFVPSLLLYLCGVVELGCSSARWAFSWDRYPGSPFDISLTFITVAIYVVFGILLSKQKFQKWHDCIPGLKN